MGFFSSFTKPFRNVARAITHPTRIVKLIKNPAAKIIPAGIRTSSLYKKIGRPIIKVAAGAALGAVTGGVGLAGSTLAFSGLSVAGGIAGATASAAGGGLSSKGFSPLKNAVIPAAAGLLAGNVARGVQAAKNAQNIARGAQGISKGVSAIKKVQTAKKVAATARANSATLASDNARLSATQKKIAALKAANGSAVKATAGRSITPTATKKKHGATITLAMSGLVVGGPVGAAIGAGAGLILDNEKGVTA